MRIQSYFRLLAEFTLARDLITPHVVGAGLKKTVISCKLHIVHTSLLFPGPVQEQVKCKCVNSYALMKQSSLVVKTRTNLLGAFKVYTRTQCALFKNKWRCHDLCTLSVEMS